MALPKKYRIRKKQAPAAGVFPAPVGGPSGGARAPVVGGGNRKKLAAPKPRKKYVFRPR